MQPRELLPWRSLRVDAPCGPDQVVDRLLDDSPPAKRFIGDVDGDDFALRLQPALHGRDPLVEAYGHMEPRAIGTRVQVTVKPHGVAYVGMLLHGLVLAGVLVAPALIFHVAQDPRPHVIARAIGLFLAAFVLVEWALVRFDASECDRALRLRLLGDPPAPASYRGR